MVQRPMRRWLAPLGRSGQRRYMVGDHVDGVCEPPAATLVHGAVENLVSCIMPTCGRAEFVARSLQYFRRQDYQAKELIIIHELPQDLPDLTALAADLAVRCVQAPLRSSIGTKRNLGVQAAQGALIAQWDDDDWFSSQRLSRQLAPILGGQADITGLTGGLMLTLHDGCFWDTDPDLFARLFVQSVYGGTLVYRRRLWSESDGYPDTSLREDADFLSRLLARGARLERVSGQDLFVYIRHGRNTWRFEAGCLLGPEGWFTVAEPVMLAADLDFYAACRASAEQTAVEPPLVSCIMPTADRPAFVPEAIRQFLAQDYPRRELIIVDDGHQSVADLVPDDPAIRYLRLPQRLSVGAKRNMACAQARGSLIAHWDDDDWRAAGWLSAQVNTLQRAQADICGIDRVYFHEPHTGRAWQYVYDGRLPWVCGGSLCYRREYWLRRPFPDIDVGEDNAFVWGDVQARIAVNPAQHLYIATVHPGNTSPKITTDSRWKPLSGALTRSLMSP
jgi:glycosyltransferase involved in cell wall biosynthesis